MMNCPDCGAASLADLGPLPEVWFFAGRRLERPLPGGRLLHCQTCDLRLRHPNMGLATYQALYDNTVVDNWTVGRVREDQRLVQALAAPAQADASRPTRVLDFGCYAGDMLSLLPSVFVKFGVEINRSAGMQASRRTGARVECSLDEIPVDLRFDLIIAMDVIEHVGSPRALAQQLAQRLRPGGRLVITTGDGGNWMWRLVGSRWWYCYYPEHIAFISQAWLVHHAHRLGLALVQARRFNYLCRSERPRLHGWLKFFRYLAAPSLHRARQQSHLDRHGTDLGVPGIGLTRDHLLVELVRTPVDA